jgi:hypothetical protein
MLPFSTLINLCLLLPIPEKIKNKARDVFYYFVGWAFVVSLIFFLFYMSSYNSLHFENELTTLEARLEMKSKIWKIERNYHITFFNLVNWMVGAGTCRLLNRLDEKAKKKN